ncbi:hypothetical protein E2P81_ATG05456 [Venturia nashicola]|nr:hypothetical protein E2P81_ATG05456 [Venturia nashicola]
MSSVMTKAKAKNTMPPPIFPSRCLPKPDNTMDRDLVYNTASTQELADFCKSSAHRALSNAPHIADFHQQPSSNSAQPYAKKKPITKAMPFID